MSPSLADSLRYCERLARRTGKNFYWSFLTLPRQMYQDMCVLYAFMRWTDDLGDDESQPLAERRKMIDDWRSRVLTAVHAWDLVGPHGDRPESNGGEVDRGPAALLPALVDLLRRRQIPVALLCDVIAGVESDLTPSVIETFDQLQQYCYQVAGAVGLCCIQIWGYAGDEARQLAIHCGTAFQLTNILRDLREDALRDRVYLPREDLERFGITPDDFREGRRSDAFRALMAFQVQRAQGYFDQGARLVPLLSPAGRRVHSAMLQIYGGLLSEIERRDYDVFSSRVELSTFQKLRAALRGWW